MMVETIFIAGYYSKYTTLATFLWQSNRDLASSSAMAATATTTMTATTTKTATATATTTQRQHNDSWVPAHLMVRYVIHVPLSSYRDICWWLVPDCDDASFVYLYLRHYALSTFPQPSLSSLDPL
jgi:hypothetical protein